jgi:hypothetical protein
VVLALCNIDCNIDTRDGAKAEIVSQIIAAERTQDFVPKARDKNSHFTHHPALEGDVGLQEFVVPI